MNNNKPNAMVRLLNSSMMPCPGRYDLKQIDARFFGQRVREAHDAGKLVSYIGYPETAGLISGLSGVPIRVSRDTTVLNSGDILLICRLPYRVQPGTKGPPRDLIAEDMHYFICYFTLDV